MFTKAVPVATAALAALALLPATPASAADHDVNVYRGYVGTVREPGSSFMCPQDEVMIGRAHTGDENGYTTYYCGIVVIDGTRVEALYTPYKVTITESSGKYTVPDGYALVGRSHYGDENGSTTYYAKKLEWRGQSLRILYRQWTADMKESKHASIAPGATIMTGRYHYGDENGRTAHEYGEIRVP